MESGKKLCVAQKLTIPAVPVKQDKLPVPRNGIGTRVARSYVGAASKSVFADQYVELSVKKKLLSSSRVFLGPSEHKRPPLAMGPAFLTQMAWPVHLSPT